MSNSQLSITTPDSGGREASLTGEVIEITVGIDNVREDVSDTEVDQALLRVIAAQCTQLGIDTHDGAPLAVGSLDLVWDPEQAEDSDE